MDYCEQSAFSKVYQTLDQHHPSIADDMLMPTHTSSSVRHWAWERHADDNTRMLWILLSAGSGQESGVSYEAPLCVLSRFATNISHQGEEHCFLTRFDAASKRKVANRLFEFVLSPGPFRQHPLWTRCGVVGPQGSDGTCCSNHSRPELVNSLCVHSKKWFRRAERRDVRRAQKQRARDSKNNNQQLPRKRI